MYARLNVMEEVQALDKMQDQDDEQAVETCIVEDDPLAPDLFDGRAT